MPVGRDPKTAGFARVPGEGLGVHDAGGVVQDDVDCASAVVRVERIGEGGGGVVAVEVVDGGVGVGVRVGGG